jgi:hypothetical protein
MEAVKSFLCTKCGFLSSPEQQSTEETLEKTVFIAAPVPGRKKKILRLAGCPISHLLSDV